MKRSNVICHQTGAALLLMAAAMIIAAATLSYQLMGGLGAKLKRQNAQEVAQVLADAKENLLVFASSIPQLYSNNCSGQPCGIGFFPTPDVNNDGSPDGNTSSLVGRLPSQQTTGTYFFFHLRDRNPNQWLDTPYPIWYALPATMTTTNPTKTLSIQADSNISSRPALNSNSLEEMFKSSNNICKVSPEGICLDSNGSGTAVTTSPVVALLFYAGDPIAGQNRPSNNVADYLDMSNGDGDRIFLQSFPVGQTCQNGQSNTKACFNDIVLPITLADWTNAMEARVKSEFGSANLPSTLCSASWRTANPTHWAVLNQWDTVKNICP